MALRTLVLNKRIREKKAELERLRAAKQELETREKQLEADIEAANTEEEQAAVDQAIEQFDHDSDENRTQTAALEGEIADLEAQLEAAEREQDEATPAAVPAAPAEERNNNNSFMRRNENMPRNFSRRELTRESLTHKEVREFYQNIVTMIQSRANGNSLANASLVVPEIVIARIDDRMGDYATVAREVETLSVGGTSRVILDGADPEAIWVEMSGAISEVESSFEKVELDGWKLAGYMSIPNDIIDDSMINLAEYVEKKLAKAIAKSRDQGDYRRHRLHRKADGRYHSQPSR